MLVVKNPPANAGKVRNLGLIPGSERSPGRGNSNPLQYSCLENPSDRGAWWAMVHRFAESWTWLKQLSTHTHIHKSSSFPKGKPIFPKRMPAFLWLLSWPWLWRAQGKKELCRMSKIAEINPHSHYSLFSFKVGHKFSWTQDLSVHPYPTLTTLQTEAPSSEKAQVQARTEPKHTPNK